MTVCWAETEEERKRTAREWWPNIGLAGDLSQELTLPQQFEEASAMVTEDDVAETVPCGPDPERHVDLIRQYEGAGFDHVYGHQVGPDQDGFFRFYEREVMPELGVASRAGAGAR